MDYSEMGKINPLALAVLGLLAEHPRHPYEVAFTMRQRHMHEHIRLNLGTMYHTFEQLHRAGWIEPMETSREGRRPERTVYTLTPAGKERFQNHLRELIREPTEEYSSFEAGLSFMHHLSAEEAAELLRLRAFALGHQIAIHDQVLGTLGRGGLSRLALIEAEMVQEQRKWQLEWVKKIASEIESGELEWFAGVRPEKKEGSRASWLNEEVQE